MLLSIVIPSYNHEQYVLRTLQAAARIDIQDKEIIVIDDGSSDNSQHIIRQYIASVKSHINIRLIARENRGLVKTLNEGLNIALGKYFYAVASDDIPISHGVTALIKILESNAELNFAMGNALVMYSEEQRDFRPAYGDAHKRFFALQPSKRQREIFINYPAPMLLQSTVFTTSALKAISGWREDIIWDDLPMFIRMMSHFPCVGKDFSYRPDIAACFYRQHPTNTYKNTAKQLMMVEQALTILCPPEWRDMAICRKTTYYAQIALRHGRFAEVGQLIRSAITRAGIGCLLLAASSELKSLLLAKFYKAATVRISSPIRMSIIDNVDNRNE